MSNIVPFERNDWPVVVNHEGAVHALEVMKTNSLDGKVNLGRIRLPSGTSKDFQFSDDSGAKKLRCVVVFQKMIKRFYGDPFGEENGPPDCSSIDLVDGIGDPGILCVECRNNEFGSARTSDGGKGRGKACQDRLCLFVYLENDLIPSILELPATSLQAWKKFATSLTNGREYKWPNGMPRFYWEVVCSLTLETQKSPVAHPVARIVVESLLDADDAKFFAEKNKEFCDKYMDYMSFVMQARETEAEVESEVVNAEVVEEEDW